ncbi:MAG: acylase [Alphaproteobacteria bacterium]
MIRRIAVLFVPMLLLALAGAGAWLWSPLPDHPDTEPLLEKARSYSAEIIRDKWGIPHIYGARDVDVAFGLAYAHAEDDFQTMQTVAAATRGRLARYQGADAAPADYLVHLLGVWETVETRYDTDLSPEARAFAQAYADGMNLYAAEHPDDTWKGLLPFTGKDVVAGFVFKTPFFYKLDKQIMELLTGEGKREIALSPDEKGHAFHLRMRSLAATGSNAIAVAPGRSADGKTRLVINSHQPYDGPVAWYEAHLKSDEGLEMYGGTFPAAPVILHGFNRDLGWANTVNKPDLADFYVLERNPDDPMQYRLDGKWVEFERKTVEIPVRLFGPFVWRAKRALLISEHGPVLETDRGTYALRFAGMNEIRHLEQYLALNRARSFEDWMAAMRLQALPNINYIYADKTGRIAFVHNGQYPDRKPGWDWSKDLPGTRSDLIWRGYLPFEKVPRLVDPQSGLLFNANNTPFSATDGPDNLGPEGFPDTMGLETHQTNRSLRLMELSPEFPRIGPEELRRIKFDKAYSDRSTAASVIAEVLAHDWSEEPELARAAEHLRAWDLGTEKSNRHAALGVLTTLRHVTERITGADPGKPEANFRAAVRWLKKHHGRLDPEWGEVNRIVRGETDLAIGGGPDILRAVYPAEIGEDGILHATAGDTWLAFVAWDEAGGVSAEAIHQYGSATLDETSPHYADQTPLFVEEQLRPVSLDREEILDGATRRYRVGAAADLAAQSD